MASLGGSLLSGPGLLNRSISIPPRKGFDYSCTSKTIYLGQQPISKAATAMPRRIDEINRAFFVLLLCAAARYRSCAAGRPGL